MDPLEMIYRKAMEEISLEYVRRPLSQLSQSSNQCSVRPVHQKEESVRQSPLTDVSVIKSTGSKEGTDWLTLSKSDATVAQLKERYALSEPFIRKEKYTDIILGDYMRFHITPNNECTVQFGRGAGKMSYTCQLEELMNGLETVVDELRSAASWRKKSLNGGIRYTKWGDDE